MSHLIPKTLDEAVGSRVSSALLSATRAGLPGEVLHSYGRWWQLETFLRNIAYIELNAAFGSGWEDALSRSAVKRSESAKALTYLAGPDEPDPMAFLDTFDLFDLLDNWWEELFVDDIGIPRGVWTGRSEELNAIRRRIAHARRPHPDDASRIEQTLRDLETGANTAYRSYIQFGDPMPWSSDPVVKDWIGLEHDSAHLVEHGIKNKGIEFDLSFSARPWADTSTIQSLSRKPGFFWVARVAMASGKRSIRLDAFLGDAGVRRSMPAVSHLIMPDPASLYALLPTVNEPDDVSNAIGWILNACFTHSTVDERWSWDETVAGLESKVDAGGLLSVLTGLWPEDPVSYFGVGPVR